jgi:hypothetical protein
MTFSVQLETTLQLHNMDSEKTEATSAEAAPAPSTEAVPASAAAAAPAEAAAVPAPDPFYVFDCPHCGMVVQVPRDGLNCQIFRLGVFRSNPDEQIPPHASRAECERLLQEGLIYGCGRPFIYRGGATAQICDYI